MSRSVGILAWIWAVSGFLAMLVWAVVRLAAQAATAMGLQLDALHWGVLLANVAFMAYYEGYKGFQLAFSPRFAARAHALLEAPSTLRLALAPLFCMGFFHAPRRRVISAIVLTLAIIAIVIVFRMLPQPWRGILDAGVVVGLSWGIAATAWYCVDALRLGEARVSPEIVDAA